jgi:hypothetical protein
MAMRIEANTTMRLTVKRVMSCFGVGFVSLLAMESRPAYTSGTLESLGILATVTTLSIFAICLFDRVARPTRSALPVRHAVPCAAKPIGQPLSS